MRISDWSSDVCSSDLLGGLARRHVGEIADHPRGGVHRVHAVGGEGGVRFLAAHVAADRGLALVAGDDLHRSEERRVGKEGVSTVRSRWLPDHSKKINNN